MRPDQELITKAASVATRAPVEWAALMKALREYADVSARQCVASPPDQLQLMQGRAQQCAALTTLFEGAVVSADRIQQKSSAAHGVAVQRRS